MHAPASPTSDRSAAGAIVFNLAAITIVLALAGLALAYGLDTARRQDSAASVPEVNMLVQRTVAGTELSIPRGLLRYEEQAATGFSEEVDLRFALPLGPDGAKRFIDLTLVPRSKARPSASLLDRVYLHQFTLSELSGPPGLIGKPLRGEDGFEGETVWYDALSPDPFVAKCQIPVPNDKVGRCLRTVFFDTVAAIYSFDADVLESWRAFDAEVEAVLSGTGVRRTK